MLTVHLSPLYGSVLLSTLDVSLQLQPNYGIIFLATTVEAVEKHKFKPGANAFLLSVIIYPLSFSFSTLLSYSCSCIKIIFC